METGLTYRNLIELFHRSLAAVTDPDKLAVEILRSDRHETLTFRQLREQVQTFATWLLGQSGLHPGD